MRELVREFNASPPGDSLETGGRYAPCFGVWLFAGVTSYSLGNSKREYSRNQGSSGEIPERDRLGTLLWGMTNLFCNHNQPLYQ